jgi:hypothetical protein
MVEHAPMSEEGAAAWDLALQQGCWRYASVTVSASMGGSVTVPRAIAIDTEAAMARCEAEDPGFRAGVRALLRHIEEGRAKAEIANSEAMRDGASRSGPRPSERDTD